MITNNRILIVDDNEAIHEDFRKILSPKNVSSDLDDAESILFGDERINQERLHFVIDSAMQGQEALAMVQAALAENHPYAIVFMDMRMPPGWDGIETLMHIWQSDANIQAVICSAYSDYSWDDIARMFGHSDNLLVLKKPFDTIEVIQLAHALARKWLLNQQANIKMEELGRLVDQRTHELQTINHSLQSEILERQRVEEDLKTQRQQLEYLASYDELTGLPNRSLFYKRLTYAMDQARRQGTQCALAFIDLDNFKYVNDTFGHHAGDDLLRMISSKLNETVRRGDVLCRFGGDEFALLIDGISNAEHIRKIIERINATLGQVCTLGKLQLYPTASIGVAIFPDDGMDVESLLKNADAAMYKAKELGRNNFQFYTNSMNQDVSKRLMMETNLRKALERQEFFLLYQPIVNIHTEQVVAVEALLRWRNQQGEIISPDSFIRVAELSGLIVPIGQWVLQEACQQGKAWASEGIVLNKICVNLSARQFQHRELLSNIRDVMEHSGLAKGWLELEITESAVMQEPEITANILAVIKALGVTIAIDDFGTGYSSLAYLKRFPVDKLKIDRTFVSDICRDPDDAAIVFAVINMAHSLGIGVIAEGVETFEQLQYLRAKGCDEAQGYYFGRPMVARDITAMIANKALVVHGQI